MVVIKSRLGANFGLCPRELAKQLLMHARVLAIATGMLPLFFYADGQAQDFGQLVAVREHMAWPAPESLVRDLQSNSEDVRFKALRSLGVTEPLARNPSTETVAKAEPIQIRYAALGSGDTQQAIIAAQVGGSYIFAAVAVQNKDRWERVAYYDCWCKYEPGSAMDTFVSLASAPDGRYELVLRASGGGTGMYTQNELHFRLFRGEMKAVMSFESRVESSSVGNPPPWFLDLTQRWFRPSMTVQLQDGRIETVAVLAESHGRTTTPADIYYSVKEMMNVYLKGVTCKTFRWNAERFHYDPVSIPNPCQTHSP